MDAATFVAAVRANPLHVLSPGDSVLLGVEMLQATVAEQDTLIKLLLATNRKLLDRIDRLEGRR